MVRRWTLVRKDYGKWGRHYITIEELEKEIELYGDKDGLIQKEIDAIRSLKNDKS